MSKDSVKLIFTDQFSVVRKNIFVRIISMFFSKRDKNRTQILLALLVFCLTYSL